MFFPNHTCKEEVKMAFNDLITIKKSLKYPQEGDIFVLQPQKDVFYFGKVIKTNLESSDSFIKGMSLIYVYAYSSHDKVIPKSLEEEELLIAPMIVNNQPWVKGYFETVDNVPVSENEKKVEFAFWDVLREECVDIYGHTVSNRPKYCGIYGLGSYGSVGKEVQKAIALKNSH